MLYGRDLERARIGELLTAARRSRSGALVVRGEPGIGKTALLEDTRERADDMHVLAARGVESESELPFAALHQLLHSALGYVERIPEPQAKALSGALGLAEAESTERFLVSAACLSLLSELSERRPVLCLVDDAHWLDTATADALLFVARRLEAEGIAMLFAAREGDVRTFEADGVESLLIGGLDAGSSATLLERAAGVDVDVDVLQRLVDQTAGNALALLEVPGALTPSQLAGSEPLPEALPMTGRIEKIFLERVRRLPEPTQRLLLVAAADDSEELGLVLTASAELGVEERALDAAEESGLLIVHGTGIEFRHPLVRSAVYEGATSGDRRAAHRALAAALGEAGDEGDRRAWHLASSGLEADETIAEAMERVAERAVVRGGYASAAKALERAADLSVDPRERTRRLVGAARAASIAGADEHALAYANQATSLAETPEQRADLALVFGQAALRAGRPLDTAPMLVGSAREVADVNPAKAMELLILALSAASGSGDDALLLETNAVAAGVVPSEGDERTAIVQTFIRGFAADRDGDAAGAVSWLRPAIELAAGSDDTYVVFMGSVAALVIGDDPSYDSLLSRAVAVGRARGELGTLSEAIALRAAQLLTVQRFDEAAHAAEDALQFGREVRAVNHMLMPRAVLAVVAAVRGEDDDARRRADEVLEVARAHNLIVRGALAVYALALLDLGAGRWSDARERLQSVATINNTFSMRIAVDRIEAAVRTGRQAEAEGVLGEFESWGSQTSSAWAAPAIAGCRALLAEGDEATTHFEHALGLADGARPFDRARIHLFYGEHLRRERRRADARVQLRGALDEFERLRATRWVERAASELRATGETARKRDPSTFDQLTPQEIQISRLVAAGMSNKEVGAQLYLSPRTIDYHLRNVFAKLGLTSRTQLAHIPLGGDEPDAAEEAASATG